MSLPLEQPSGGTPTSAEFVRLQSLWAKILDPIVAAFSPDSGIPVGTMWLWAGTSAPQKFLICSGQTVLQEQYPELFRLIRTSYNTGGEPAGYFRLPAASESFTLIIRVVR